MQRSCDLIIVSKVGFSRLIKRLSEGDFDKKTLGNSYPRECPDLFERKVCRALSERLIGESMAAELVVKTQGQVADFDRMELDVEETGC